MFSTSACLVDKSDSSIPLMSIAINGISKLPPIVDLRRNAGPTFLANVVKMLSSKFEVQLVFSEQTATGAVVLEGFKGGKMVFMPHTLHMDDSRVNGIYEVDANQFQVVINGLSVTLAPTLVHLDQLTAMFPGKVAEIANNGTITATFNGTNYVVRPSISVQRDVATGRSQLIVGNDGVYRFIDADGNKQILHPAFGEHATEMDLSTTLTIQPNDAAKVIQKK